MLSQDIYDWDLVYEKVIFPIEVLLTEKGYDVKIKAGKLKISF